MSEGLSNEGLVPGQDATVKVSGGAMLRKAREAAGLHIAALAVALKVPVKKLEALETDRFDLLPDTVFVRALASSVCRTLKIDPTPILENLPHNAAPRLKTDESGINTPFRATGDVSGLPFWEQLSKPVVLAVLLLLVGVVVLVFFPFADHIKADNATKSATADISPVVLAPVTPPVQIEPPAVVPALTPALPSNLMEPVAQVIQAPVAAASAAAVAPAASASPTALKPAPEAVSTSAMLVLKARASSWVEVVDARGAVQVRKIMTEGEVIGASGATPLSIVLGRADSMEVQVHGKPFDPTRVAKDNVARFEVK